MGCWQARSHASWPEHTNTVDGAIETLRGDVGARRRSTRLKEDDTHGGCGVMQNVTRDGQAELIRFNMSFQTTITVIS
jgi:hypothetical protein